METYTCVKCLAVYPADRFRTFRHSRNHKLYRDKTCKTCRNKANWITKRSNPERYAKYREYNRIRDRNRKRARPDKRRKQLTAVLAKHGLLNNSNK